MKYNVRIGENHYEVEIDDLNTRPIRAKIGNEWFEVTPEAPAAPQTLPAPQPGSAARSSIPAAAGPLSPKDGNTLTAPLPGVLTEINVSAGDSVSAGQQLCVIKAMKMKNAIRATRAGKVAKVLAAAGQQVAHRQALVEFE
ncbi:MAG: biotin/lipoyl-binding protein [Anaerolineales bacterium]